MTTNINDENVFTILAIESCKVLSDAAADEEEAQRERGKQVRFEETKMP